jgi:hypothetical protein
MFWSIPPRDFPPAITEIQVTYPADLAGPAEGEKE